MRLPFFRSKPQAITPTRAERKRPAAAADESTLVEAARTRARRRLVGALVLLIIGVVGFPIVFETQPRPLPVDTPILTPSTPSTAAVRREAPAAAPRPAAPRPVVQAVVEAPAEATPVEAPASLPAQRPTSTVQPVVITERAAPAAAPAPASAPATPVIAAPPVVAAAASAQASSAGSGRFVVQVGAYSDAGTLRDARAKVEKLGLKTYTQVVSSDAGPRTRVRLGPYASRDEADAAAAKLKRAGLPANILAL
jgi:DedD protein